MLKNQTIYTGLNRPMVKIENGNIHTVLKMCGGFLMVVLCLGCFTLISAVFLMSTILSHSFSIAIERFLLTFTYVLYVLRTCVWVWVCTLQRCIFLIYSHWRWHIFIHTLNWSYFPNYTPCYSRLICSAWLFLIKWALFSALTYNVVFRPLWLWMWIHILWRPWTPTPMPAPDPKPKPKNEESESENENNGMK